MTATALAHAINGINRDYLNELCGECPDEGNASQQVSPNARPKCGVNGCFGGIAGSPCFCGVPEQSLDDAIILQNPSGTLRGKVAVLATIDEATKPNGADRELPVIIAVGINYGQMGAFNYLATPVPLWDQTGMRTRLDQAVALIDSKTENDCNHRSFPPEYHLVATNFFPWITQNSWLSYNFNAIEETLLIGCHGFCDPFAHIEAICDALGAKLQGVVFHGANNAVPYMGADFLRTRMASKWKAERPDITFCDNLGGSIRGMVNAVRLCGQRLGRSDVPDNFEE